jgi:hypothetical protein
MRRALRHYREPPLFYPGPIRGQQLGAQATITWLQTARAKSRFAIEVSADNAGILALIHTFGDDAPGVESALVKAPEVTSPFLCKLLDLAAQRENGLESLIVPWDQLHRVKYLRHVLAGLPRSYFCSRNFPLADLVDRTPLGLLDEVCLYSCKAIDGLELYELGPALPEIELEPLSPALRMLAWVLRNGYVAHLRWLHFNRPFGAFEWRH